MGFSPPVVDGNRLNQVDNGSNLFAFDAMTGKRLWEQNLGTIQKASPVLADGKLYVGTENGRFFILKPSGGRRGARPGTTLGPDGPEEITASPRLSPMAGFTRHRRRFIAFGRNGPSAKSAAIQAPWSSRTAEPAYVLVTPADGHAKPGDTVPASARLFDDKGNFLRDATANWSLTFEHDRKRQALAAAGDARRGM